MSEHESNPTKTDHEPTSNSERVKVGDTVQVRRANGEYSPSEVIGFDRIGQVGVSFEVKWPEGQAPPKSKRLVKTIPKDQLLKMQTGEDDFIIDPARPFAIGQDISVRRTGGDVEGDWTVRAFIESESKQPDSEHEVLVEVAKYEPSENDTLVKVVHLAELLELNSPKSPETDSGKTLGVDGAIDVLADNPNLTHEQVLRLHKVASDIINRANGGVHPIEKVSNEDGVDSDDDLTSGEPEIKITPTDDKSKDTSSERTTIDSKKKGDAISSDEAKKGLSEEQLAELKRAGITEKDVETYYQFKQLMDIARHNPGRLASMMEYPSWSQVRGGRYTSSLIGRIIRREQATGVNNPTLSKVSGINKDVHKDKRQSHEINLRIELTAFRRHAIRVQKQLYSAKRGDDEAHLEYLTAAVLMQVERMRGYSVGIRDGLGKRAEDSVNIAALVKANVETFKKIEGVLAGRAIPGKKSDSGGGELITTIVERNLSLLKPLCSAKTVLSGLRHGASADIAKKLQYGLGAKGLVLPPANTTLVRLLELSSKPGSLNDEAMQALSEDVANIAKLVAT